MTTDSDLPSIKAMLSFESTVRLGSMSAAARELDISQPLVSQRIRSLEEDLGIVLVDRASKPVQATQAGQKFYAQIAASIMGIKAAVAQVKQQANEQPRVKIAAPFGFMFFWILPKLQKLQSEFEDVQFDIQPSVKINGDKNSESDIVFYFGKSEKKYKYEKQIITEEVIPLCSRSFAESHNLTAGKTLVSISDYPLLHMDANNSNWFDWGDWSQILNIENKQESTIFYYHNYPLLIDAIKSGQGIGLGWVGLIEPLVDDGLVVPLGPKIKCAHRGYHICSDYPHTSLIKSLLDWFNARVEEPAQPNTPL